MPHRYPELEALIRNVEAKASDELDPLAVVALLLKLTIRSEADPYLLIGQLVEGIAETVVRRIPAEKQGEVAVNTIRLFCDRLEARGVI